MTRNSTEIETQTKKQQHTPSLHAATFLRPLVALMSHKKPIFPLRACGCGCVCLQTLGFYADGPATHTWRQLLRTLPFWAVSRATEAVPGAVTSADSWAHPRSTPCPHQVHPRLTPDSPVSPRPTPGPPQAHLMGFEQSGHEGWVGKVGPDRPTLIVMEADDGPVWGRQALVTLLFENKF